MELQAEMLAVVAEVALVAHDATQSQSYIGEGSVGEVCLGLRAMWLGAVVEVFLGLGAMWLDTVGEVCLLALLVDGH